MNTKTFTALYLQHHPGLFCFVLGMARNRANAEDVTARAFLKAWQHRAQLNGNFKPWLYQIAANEMKTWYRRESYLMMKPLTEDHHEIPAPDDMTRDLAGRIEWQAAAQAATRLAGRARTAMLCAARGLSVKASALYQGVPLGTAASRLNAARRQMRELCLA